jgi:hypothetical protein
VADQHAFNRCDGVCPRPVLCHVVRVSPPVPLKASGGAYGGVVLGSVEDLMLLTSMARQKNGLQPCQYPEWIEKVTVL